MREMATTLAKSGQHLQFRMRSIRSIPYWSWDSATIALYVESRTIHTNRSDGFPKDDSSCQKTVQYAKQIANHDRDADYLLIGMCNYCTDRNIYWPERRTSLMRLHYEVDQDVTVINRLVIEWPQQPLFTRADFNVRYLDAFPLRLVRGWQHTSKLLFLHLFVAVCTSPPFFSSSA
jgi:hypothetical protein